MAVHKGKTPAQINDPTRCSWQPADEGTWVVVTAAMADPYLGINRPGFDGAQKNARKC